MRTNSIPSKESLKFLQVVLDFEFGKAGFEKLPKADCISLENRQECTQYQEECGHYYTHRRNGSGHGYDWGYYTIYCCCTSPLCNHYTNATLRSCSADECTSTNHTKLSESCFCNDPMDKIRFDDLPLPSEQISLDALIIHYLSILIFVVLVCCLSAIIIRKGI